MDLSVGVCRQGLLRHETRVFRTSRLTTAQLERQALNVLPGRKCRIGMYVATSTDEKMLDELKGWQQGETGTAVKYKVTPRPFATVSWR